MTDHHSYECGHCGRQVSTSIGLCKQYEPTHVRVCPRCQTATTFHEHSRHPWKLRGKTFDADSKTDSVKETVLLYDEARFALRENASSCAVLMFRKLLMHIAVERGAREGKKFAEYVEHLKSEGIVGKPQYPILERIRKAGNQKSHEVRCADLKEAADLLNLVTHLIEGVYFIE